MGFLDTVFGRAGGKVSFLSDAQITPALLQLLDHARQELILISPYIEMNKRIVDTLLKQKKSGVQIRIVHRYQLDKKTGMPETTLSWDGYGDIKQAYLADHVFLRENLHAKCYVSEASALLTSMNLYAYSQENNSEMALLVHKIDYPDLYAAIFAYASGLCADANSREKDLVEGKTYSKDELWSVFPFKDEIYAGIKETEEGDIVLFARSKGKYVNKEIDGILHFQGQNTGGVVQEFRYGNALLRDCFEQKRSNAVFLFKDNVYCGKHGVCQQPYSEEGRIFFPLAHL